MASGPVNPLDDIGGVPHDEALDSFLDKWRARWPEWPIAEGFVPEAQRRTALAWATLLQELTDAAWGGSDARPGEAKLAWWQDELHGWANGMRRHPLGLALQREAAPWVELARALPALAATRERPRDPTHAFDALEPFAQAAAGVEAALFAGDAARGPAVGNGKALAAALLHLRLAHHPRDAVPANLGDDAGAHRWAGTLRERVVGEAMPRVRGIWNGLARARLRQSDSAQPLSPLRALWAAWRGARR